MRASLDTNAIIHFYKAGLQKILFDFFDEGVFIYEQIRKIELENHGQDVLDEVDKDIALNNIELYTYQKLKELGVHRIFEENFNENRNLYGSGDLGEVDIAVNMEIKDDDPLYRKIMRLADINEVLFQCLLLDDIWENDGMICAKLYTVYVVA